MDDVFFILNLENKKIEIHQHFSLILCYFWRQNCLKTWILAFWTTLVNLCWPHVCDITKYISEACKYLSKGPFSLNISSRNIKIIMEGEPFFLCLEPFELITIDLHLLQYERRIAKKWLFKVIWRNIFLVLNSNFLSASKKTHDS